MQSSQQQSQQLLLDHEQQKIEKRHEEEQLRVLQAHRFMAESAVSRLLPVINTAPTEKKDTGDHSFCSFVVSLVSQLKVSAELLESEVFRDPMVGFFSWAHDALSSVQKTPLLEVLQSLDPSVSGVSALIEKMQNK